MLDETVKTPKVRGVVEKINASVDSLESLFNALLDISRLDAGVMKEEKISFNLQSLFSRLANDFDLLAKEKGLSIVWPESPCIVYSDPLLLEQILRNYISNAIRYSDSGEINILCEENNGEVTIQVIDNGIGIPKEEQQEIFNEFYQLGNPERDRNKGLGLGLAIVRRTAKLLGHPIFHNSESGQGSTFGITVESGKFNSNEINAPVVGTDIVTQDLTIVIIDDEASIREGMQSLLEVWGYEVIVAASQDDAMLQLKKVNKNPDVIIADYRLQDHKTGIEAVQALRAKYHNEIPALIITGDTEAEHLRDVSDYGFQMLHKPVASAKLRTFMRNIQLRK